MESPRFRASGVALAVACFLVLFLRNHRVLAEGNDLDGNSEIGDEDLGVDGNYRYVNAVETDERSELCNTDVTPFLPPPYNNITNVICKPVWNNFVLRYQRRKDNVMTFILSAVYTTGWVGMAFSKDGKMTGSSAMVGWFNKKGQARVKQFFLQGSKVSQVIADAGELPLTKVPPAVVIHGDMIYMAFQAKFDNPLTEQPILLAFGTRYPSHNHLSSHDDKTSLLLNFAAGSASSAAHYSGIGTMKANHGIMGILAWGLLLPVGAIIARYMKHKEPLWYYLHAGIQFVGFLFALATVILGQRLYDRIKANVAAHRGIGIFVLVLSILQILAFFLRPSKEAKIRRYWNWYHAWFGRIALFFGALNVVLGIQVGSAGISWKVVYGIQMSMILVAVIILETLSWMKKRSEKNTLPENFQMNPIS